MMVEKTSELEQRLMSIRDTKARIELLRSLESCYRSDVSKKYDPSLSDAKKNLSYKIPSQKEDVEKIVKAIRNVIGNKYTLRHDTVCKIVEGSRLEFVLDFNPETIKAVSDAKKKVDALIDKMNSDLAKLEKWKRKQLFNIANGLDFDKFNGDFDN